jgi:2,4-dienoyl-CoA reductase-like NADH-dependent reductase (Old Yellow Enzyme family)
MLFRMQNGMQAHAAYEHLLSSIEVGPRTLRNRVHVTAHTTLFVDQLRLPDRRDVAYYAERAYGGAALMTMGTSAVHPSSPLPYGVYRNMDDDIIERYRAVADAVHGHGGLLAVQLGHMAQRVYDLPQPTWSPSPVSVQAEGRVPHEMTAGEVGEVVEAFALAAARAAAAGVDGIEIQCGHGQLVNLFLSPLTNRRTDAYGGSPERRARFAREILHAVAAVVGDERMLGIRVNASDEIAGGMDEPEALDAIDLLLDTGLPHYVNVSANFFDSPVPTMHHPHGVMLPYARAVKARVAVPVFCVGRIVDPEHAERVVAAGDADVVGMTRAHIADPHVVRKIAADRRAEIRPCVGCVQMCIGELHKGRSITCMYNPITGHETERGPVERTLAERRRRVVVVGGGPGGLEAARVARRRGHEVVLLERAPELGGLMDVCAAAPGRAELGRVATWLIAEIRRLGVDVRTGVEADAASVLALEPDAVIIATGARAAAGDWGAHPAFSAARAVLDGTASVGGRVVVVDEDHRGQALFVAARLAQDGAAVTVTSSRVVVGGDLEHHTREDLYALLLCSGVDLLPGWAPLAIEDRDGATLLRLGNVFSGAETETEVDAVVGTGARPDDALAGALQGHVEVRIVGDALAPRRVESAVHEAWLAAAEL